MIKLHSKYIFTYLPPSPVVTLLFLVKLSKLDLLHKSSPALVTQSVEINELVLSQEI